MNKAAANSRINNANASKIQISERYASKATK